MNKAIKIVLWTLIAAAAVFVLIKETSRPAHADYYRHGGGGYHDHYERGYRGYNGPDVFTGALLGFGAGVALSETLAPPPTYIVPTYAPPCKSYLRTIINQYGYPQTVVGEVCLSSYDNQWHVVQ